MFFTFFFSELKYVLRQASIYLFLGLITLLVFGAIASDNVQIGGSIGNIHRNAPHIITVYTTILTVFGLLMATAFYNNAALRDYNSNFNEILFTTPVHKSAYFFGRFFSAMVLATIPLLGVFLGTLLGSIVAPVAGWVAPERFGPFYWKTFVNNYFIFILPNMFFAGTIIFAFANRWKSTIISFVGALVVIVAYIISGTLLSDIDNEKLAALTDMFGIRAYSVYSKYFTPLEKNTLNPTFTGLILWNRLIWMGAGVVILVLSYLGFSFKEKNKKVSKKKENLQPLQIAAEIPHAKTIFNRSTEWQQFKSFFFINFQSIIKSVTFKILFIFSIIILVSNLLGGFEYYGLKTFPVTYKMIDVITGATGIFILIILIFFSGELVWRDRGSKINEVIDATPHSSVISLAAKAFSLFCLCMILYLFFIGCAIIYQLIQGYTDIQPMVYIKDFLLTSFISSFVLSAFMILIQTMMNNKYLGYFVSIGLVFVLSIVLLIFDIQSNMVDLGGTPGLLYSDMSGFGPGVTGALWFNLYWFLFSLICLFLAATLWNRGVLTSFWKKIGKKKHRLPKKYRVAFITIGLLWLIVGVFVYYNTQILNTYQTPKELEKLMVAYEKKYKKYEKAPLPKITAVQYYIDIFPADRNVDVKAVMQLVNETQSPIDSFHFVADRKWKSEIAIPGGKLAFQDKNTGYRIYTLAKPMLPGDSFPIVIHSTYRTTGFENDRGNTSILENGSFLNNFDILPAYGYSSSFEISDPNTRKKYGLPPKERMPKLVEDCGEPCRANYLSDGKSDFINVSTTISTSKDQLAVAPGSLIKKWTENGRNYFQYTTDHPSLNFYSFVSARYEVATRKWNGIDLEVYYDKQHKVNIQRMLDAMQKSLEYYTKNFGPYYHKQARIIEFPRYSTFAQAFPGTMPYSESFGFIINLENEKDNNVVDAVIAHEMGHQWWAHQVIGANMQGATMLSESFAEYSSLMTMKSHTKDPMKMRQFLKYDFDRYLRGRGTEIEREVPLYEVENQGYIHYGKGSIILYALQDYIGEDKVNASLKNFLEAYRYRSDHYPTTLDFLKYLEPEVPDSSKYLINDWIKEITLYDLRMEKATFKKQADGKYKIDMQVSASKLRADSLGRETKLPISDWIDLGLFADKAEKKLMFQQRVKIDQPEMNFSFVVDSLPAKAAIDPRMILIDRIYSDNSKVAEEK